jgi:putative peptidoglycan lipid II flippase
VRQCPVHEPAARRFHRFILHARVPHHWPGARTARGGQLRCQRLDRRVAFRIPNLLRRLFGEGAFSQAFVPILAATRATEGDEVTRRLIDAVATVLFWALLFTCVIGVAAAPAIVWLMASGLERFDGAVVMTRWMFPYIGFMSLVALSAGVLNTWKRFAVPAVTPVLLNLAVIGAAWGLAPVLKRHGIEPIYALAIGVMFGGVLQLALQVPALRRIGCVPHIGLSLGSLRAAWSHPGVGRVLKQMAPALLGVSVAQLSLLINTQIASHQGVGAVSWLTYADRLMEFPTALLGVALGAILLPQLSAAQAKGDVESYSGLLDWCRARWRCWCSRSRWSRCSTTTARSAGATSTRPSPR